MFKGDEVRVTSGLYKGLTGTIVRTHSFHGEVDIKAKPSGNQVTVSASDVEVIE